MSDTFGNLDLNAPRFKASNHNVMCKSFFKKFKKINPKYKDIDNAILKTILYTYHENLYNGIIDNRDGVEFPLGMGFCFIGSCDTPKKQNTDIRLSMQYNKRIRHRNFNTDGKLAKIFYTSFPSKYKFKHRDLWSFKPSRYFSRLVAKTYPDNFTKYVSISPEVHISTMFKGNKITKYYDKKDADSNKEYNEFNFD